MSETTRRDFFLHAAGALSVSAILPDLASLAMAAQETKAGVGGEAFAVALVGVGRQGRAILAELQKLESVTVVAVCDSDETRLAAGVRRAAGAEGFADHRAMLEKRADLRGVIIATPTHLHRQIASDALQAGRHVYCEAPIAHTVDDCRALVAASAAAPKLVFHCGFEGRSNPVYKLARSFFRSDAVREVVSAQAQSYQKTSWRFPSSDPAKDKAVNWRLDPEVSLGLPGEMGAHQLDVVSWFTDATPTRVVGAGEIRLHKDGRTLADTTDCLLRLSNGVTMQLGASLANSLGGRHETLRGSNAAVRLAWSHGWMFKEADAPTQGWEVYANRQQFHNEEGITLIADATKLASQGKLKEGVGLPNPPLYYALADFVRSVTEGKPAACDAAAGARSTIAAIHAARAVTTNEAVAIDPSLYRFGAS